LTGFSVVVISTLASSRKRSLVHHPCVGDLGWVADAPEVLSSHRHKRLTS
jgi:hypothetical protein